MVPNYDSRGLSLKSDKRSAHKGGRPYASDFRLFLVQNATLTELPVFSYVSKNKNKLYPHYNINVKTVYVWLLSFHPKKGILYIYFLMEALCPKHPF